MNDDKNKNNFRFVIGETYKTQAGEMITVLGRTETKGYECLECSDGKYRYDRSNHDSDAGRVTGTNHNYNCPDNFERPELFIKTPRTDNYYDNIIGRYTNGNETPYQFAATLERELMLMDGRREHEKRKQSVWIDSTDDIKHLDMNGFSCPDGKIQVKWEDLANHYKKRLEESEKRFV